MNYFINKAIIAINVGLSTFTKKISSKLKEKNGLSGEYILIIVIGIIMVILLGGIAIKWFSAKTPGWLDQGGGKVDGFFDLI